MPQGSYHFLIVVIDVLVGAVFESVINRLDPTATFAIATNSQEALQFYERRRPDLILLCKNLPLIESLTLTQTLHARNETTPIIKLSNNLEAEEAVEKAGAMLLLAERGTRDELQKILPQLTTPKMSARILPQLTCRGLVI
jgi:CheY-like chemotaxis protein